MARDSPAARGQSLESGSLATGSRPHDLRIVAATRPWCSPSIRWARGTARRAPDRALRPPAAARRGHAVRQHLPSAANTPDGGPVGTAMIGMYAHDPLRGRCSTGFPPTRSGTSTAATRSAWSCCTPTAPRPTSGSAPTSPPATSCSTSSRPERGRPASSIPTAPTGCSAARWRPASPAPAFVAATRTAARRPPRPGPTSNDSRRRRARHHHARRLRHRGRSLRRTLCPVRCRSWRDRCRRDP